MIIDDPIDAKGRITDGVLRDASDHVNKTLVTRKAGGNAEVVPMIMVMQRVHEKDPSGVWLKMKERGEKRLSHICLPATDEYKVVPRSARRKYIGGFMNIKRRGLRALNEFSASLGSITFACQFGQQPRAKGGNILLRKYFPIRHKDELPHTFWQHDVHFYADTADKDGVFNDPTGMVAVSFYEGFLWILCYRKFKTTFNKRKELMHEMFKQFKTYNSVFKIEPKSSGPALIQSFREKPYSINCTEADYVPGNKEQRLLSCMGVVESNRVVLVEGFDDWIEAYLDECELFPNGEHDEAVDLLTMAIHDGILGASEWKRKFVSMG